MQGGVRIIVLMAMLFSILLCSYNNVAHAQCNAVTGSIPDPISGCGPLTVALNSNSSTGTITGYSWDAWGSGIRSTAKLYSNYKNKSKFIKFVDKWHPKIYAHIERNKTK